MNIRNFKPGDCIYRNKKAGNDCSYLNEKMIFVGVANDTLFCIKADENKYFNDGDLLELGLSRQDGASSGWDKGWVLSENTEEMYNTALVALKDIRDKKATARDNDNIKSKEINALVVGIDIYINIVCGVESIDINL